MGQPLVSIGLPTFNRPEGLEKTILFLIQQYYQNIEVLISDNSSTNLLVKPILEKYSALDSRIKFVIQDKNIEIEPNFNYVFHNANGKYFMWIADDDLFEKNYIVKCVDFLENNDDYLLCSGSCNYFRDGKIVMQEKSIGLHSNNSLYRLFKYFYTVNKNGLFYGVYRNNILFKSPIQKHLGADWCHIARVAYLGKINVLENYYNNRSDDGGSANRNSMLARWKITGIKKIFFETYTSYQIAKNIFNEPIFKNKINFFYSILIKLFLFLFLNFKFLAKSIRNKIK